MNLQDRFDYFVKTLTPIPLPPRCINISDVHASARGSEDPLVASGVEPVIIDTLKEYLSKGYCLLKNGDWWDTWRGKSLVDIFSAHQELVEIVDDYKDVGDLFEILGNHERDLCSYPTAIIFEGYGKKIFMDHGYLEDWPNDEGWKIGRFVIKAADELGIDPQTSPHPSNIERHLAVRKMRQELADNNPKWIFIYGHTHYQERVGENLYNSGSSVNGRVEGIEIIEGEVILKIF